MLINSILDILIVLIERRKVMNEDMNVIIERRGRPKGSLDTKRRKRRSKEVIDTVPSRKYVRYDGDSQPRSKLEALRFSLALGIKPFGELLGISNELLSLYERKKIIPSPKKWKLMKDNAMTNGIDLSDDIIEELLNFRIEKKKEKMEAKIELMKATLNNYPTRYKDE